jgi:hypothetical protein
MQLAVGSSRAMLAAAVNSWNTKDTQSGLQDEKLCQDDVHSFIHTSHISYK